MTDKIQAAEDIMLVLLRVKDSSLKEDVPLQKELFLRSKANPNLKETFNFKKHRLGSYSHLDSDMIERQVHQNNSFDFKNNDNQTSFSSSDRNYFENLNQKHELEKKFKRLKDASLLAREIYGKLKLDELLLLIYASYHYVERSDVSNNLFKKKSREKIANSKLSKKAITNQRASESLEVEI